MSNTAGNTSLRKTLTPSLPSTVHEPYVALESDAITRDLDGVGISKAKIFHNAPPAVLYEQALRSVKKKKKKKNSTKNLLTFDFLMNQWADMHFFNLIIFFENIKIKTPLTAQQRAGH
jgi:folylpolyglutamate synthase/dihydropteroate synthase